MIREWQGAQALAVAVVRWSANLYIACVLLDLDPAGDQDRLRQFARDAGGRKTTYAVSIHHWAEKHR